MYREWQNALPSCVEVCPVQYPGRGTRFSEPLFTDLVAHADAMTQGLRSLIEGPFVLFGHSMGAILAFEVARRFKEQMGVSPSMLLVASARAPHLQHHEVLTYNLPDMDLRAELRKINGTPAAILDNAEAMELLMPIVRADFQAVETYKFKSGPPLHCPISVFGGHKDEDASEADLSGWSRYTTSSFRCTMLEGGHFVVSELGVRFVETVAQALRPLLNSSYDQDS